MATKKKYVTKRIPRAVPGVRVSKAGLTVTPDFALSAFRGAMAVVEMARKTLDRATTLVETQARSVDYLTALVVKLTAERGELLDDILERSRRREGK